MKRFLPFVAISAILFLALGFTSCGAASCDVHEGKWKVTRVATCTKEGEELFVCRKCGYEESHVIEKIPHDFVLQGYTPHEDGNVCSTATYECSACHLEREEVIAEHHFVFQRNEGLQSDGVFGIDRFECEICHEEKNALSLTSSSAFSFTCGGRDYSVNFFDDLLDGDGQPKACQPIQGLSLRYVPEERCVSVQANGVSLSRAAFSAMPVRIELSGENSFGVFTSDTESVSLTGDGSLSLDSFSSKGTLALHGAALRVTDETPDLSAALSCGWLETYDGSSLRVKKKTSETGVEALHAFEVLGGKVSIETFRVGASSAYFRFTGGKVSVTGDSSQGSVGFSLKDKTYVRLIKGCNVSVSSVATGFSAPNTAYITVEEESRLEIASSLCAVQEGISFRFSTIFSFGEDKDTAEESTKYVSARYILCEKTARYSGDY